MTIKLSRNGRGWATLRIDTSSIEVTDPLHALLGDLVRMPGVDLVEVAGNVQSLEVPRSCWSTNVWASIEARVALGSRLTSPAANGLWTPKRSLFAHQVSGASFLVENEGGLCADVMGLGKTTTGIVSAETYARAERPDAARLIIAPGFTRDVWKRELLALGAIEDESQFCAVTSRDPLHESFKPKQAHWWFVHYDVVEAWASRLVTNSRGRPVVALVDEAHWIKNGKTQRSHGTAAAAGVAQARILLTGTPMVNRPAELWHPLSVLDGKRSWGSPIDFRVRYCGAFHDGYGYQDGPPTATEELRERLSGRYLRRTVEDAGVELPALSRQVLETSMDESDKLDHLGIVASCGGMEVILDALDRGAYGTEVLRALSKLRKLTSEVKLPMTMTHLESLLEQGESVVVFCHERKTAKKIATLLGDDDVGQPLAFLATGEDSQDARDAMVAAFQAGERRVMVTTYGAMREGVTLHRARAVVLHDLDWVPSAILQAEARVHRLGQTRGCMSYWAMVRDSFDSLIARHLETKGASIAASIGDTSARDAAMAIGASSFTGWSIEEEAQRLLRSWA